MYFLLFCSWMLNVCFTITLRGDLMHKPSSVISIAVCDFIAIWWPVVCQFVKSAFRISINWFCFSCILQLLSLCNQHSILVLYKKLHWSGCYSMRSLCYFTYNLGVMLSLYTRGQLRSILIPLINVFDFFDFLFLSKWSNTTLLISIFSLLVQSDKLGWFDLLHYANLVSGILQEKSIFLVLCFFLQEKGLKFGYN